MDKQGDQWWISYISENAHKESLLQTDLKAQTLDWDLQLYSDICVMKAV